MQENQKKKLIPLSFDERKLIEKLLTDGLSCAEIGGLLNRGKNTVVMEVRRYGRDEYKAETAQNDFLNRKVQKYRKLSIRNKILTENGKSPYMVLKDRIDAIEQHIEILHDTLKELLKRS